jgi:hypothetical protein
MTQHGLIGPVGVNTRRMDFTSGYIMDPASALGSGL